MTNNYLPSEISISDSEQNIIQNFVSVAKIKGNRFIEKTIAELTAILKPTKNLVDITEEIKTKAIIAAETIKKEIEQGIRLRHWTIQEDISEKVYRFQFEENGLRNPSHEICVTKNFTHIWFRFPYDQILMESIRGNKDKHGNRKGGLNGAVWAVPFWKVPITSTNIKELRSFSTKFEWEDTPTVAFWIEVLDQIDKMQGLASKPFIEQLEHTTTNNVVL